MTPTNKPAPRNAQRRAWSMFSSKHDEVSRLLEDHNLHFTFHPSDEDINVTEAYDTCIMGRFRCHNNACASKGWGSKKIAMTVRMYPGNQYNARVYFQRCKDCNRPSKPTLDGSYAERVAYRLKKWSGIEQEVPDFSRESKAPHESLLCEGCRAGHCAEDRKVFVEQWEVVTWLGYFG
ncbi:zinc-binding domain-containing protein [Calycina marina]|uniref:Zinc-binding domain-containing protein n=1 Tax=Calycina marina TaxID=1763456 RepID=A0A9P7Z111_9HELO|nr:zinc-binding domain-containing protein [Calycina marina]